MSLEDTIGHQDATESCIVCGKGVDQDRGFAKIRVGQSTINLCCPLCQEAYQANPQPYLERLGKVLARQEFQKLMRTPEGSGEGLLTKTGNLSSSATRQRISLDRDGEYLFHPRQ